MRYNNLFSATPLPVSVSFNGNIHVHAVGKCQQSKTTFLNNKKFSYIYSSIMLLVWGVFISIVNFWRRKWFLFEGGNDFFFEIFKYGKHGIIILTYLSYWQTLFYRHVHIMQHPYISIKSFLLHTHFSKFNLQGVVSCT